MSAPGTPVSTRPSPAALAPLAFVFLWSSAFIAVRAGLPEVTPLYFLAVRFALAAVLLAAIAAILRPAWGALAGRWHHLAIAGALINALYLSGGYLAMTHINGATMALVGALHPLLTALTAGPVLGERLARAQWFGLGLGIAGVALTVGTKADDLDQIAGIAWGLGGVLCLVAGTLYYGRYCRAVPLVPANMVQMAASALIVGALALAFEDIDARWTPLSLAGAVSVGGMGLLLFMLRTGTAGRVSANFYLTPGLTALLGWLALGETLTPLALAGFAVASAGVWLVNRAPGTHDGSQR